MDAPITVKVDLDSLTIDDLAELDAMLQGKTTLSDRIAFYKRLCPGQDIGKLPAMQLREVSAQILSAIGEAMNPKDATGKNSIAGSGTISGPGPVPSQ